MTANPLHSALSNEHYSPASIVEPARKVLERIDLDPASCAFANSLVGASTYYYRGMGEGVDALKAPWSFGALATRVFLNPPGGKYDKQGNPVASGPGRSSAAVWWAKLIEEWRASRVHSAIFVCFSLNVFRTAQSESSLAPYEFPFVVLGDRVRYDRNVNGVRVPGKAPQQDSAIVYVPPRDEFRAHPDDSTSGISRFADAFAHLGAVRL